MSSKKEIDVIRKNIRDKADKARKELSSIVVNDAKFLDTGKVDKVELPIGVPIKVCEGFIATNRVNQEHYNVVEVDFKKGFTLPKSRHVQKETVSIIKGILENNVWDVQGNKRKITIDENGDIRAFNIDKNENHEHIAIESGKWISVISPPIVEPVKLTFWQKLKQLFGE